MAQHLVILILDDDLGDISSSEDLRNWVFDLKSGTHADLTERSYYELPEIQDTDDSVKDWLFDNVVEMQGEIADSKGD
jgi:hypothetical protein